MSTTSYRPACASVQNTGTIPLALGVKLGFIKDNHFLFDYEHSKIIYDRCLDHVSTCQLSARCLRVFNTILRQTVGFGKLEDHATTTRLEQLTKIRHDHIGNVLRYLSKRNIIKWRKGGKYNNYLSINYDFASWGEQNPDKQNPNNDPTVLLPDYYTKTPIDQGLSFDDEPEDRNLDLEKTIQSEKDSSVAMQAIMDDKYLDKKSVIAVVSEIVEDKFIQIKQLFEQNTTVKNPVENRPIETQLTSDQLNRQTKPEYSIESQQKAESIQAAETMKDIQLEQQEYEIRAYQSEITELKQQSEQDIIELKQQSEQEIATLKQQSKQEMTELKQQSEKIQLENSRLHEKHIEIHVKNQVPEYSSSAHYAPQTPQNNPATHNVEAMDYPVKLSENDCISAKNLVLKSPHKAQDILDLLAIRLNQTQPVLNNPIAYLARLVQKEQKNELDFSALQTFIRPQILQRNAQSLIESHNRDYQLMQHYQDSIDSYDLQSDDPDNVADFECLKEQYSERYMVGEESYLIVKRYIEEHQLDRGLLKQLDCNLK